MKKFMNEFKEFISRGNVLDMAVGVVIGSAFTAIVNSLVSDIITPLIGVIIGGLDFSGLSIHVGDANVGYGSFIQAVINFLIVSFVIFCVVRSFNKLANLNKAKELEEKAAVPETPAEDVMLLREIRDLLASGKDSASK